MADEFTSAINRIEARRAKESAQSNGTVNVEQTIRELHIDASTEEVLREISFIRTESQEAAQRTQVIAEERVAAKRGRRQRIVWRVLAAFGFMMLGAGGQLITDYHHQYHGSATATAPIVTRTIGELGSGQEIFLSSAQLESLIGTGGDLHDNNIGDIKGTASSSSQSIWPVVRSGDNLYVYGYADKKSVSASLSTQQISASGGDDDDTALVAVPLRGVVALNVTADSPLSSDQITLTHVPQHLTGSPG